MTTSQTAARTRWGGGVSPWGMDWRKLMMWWFILTDALLFAGFLAGYGFSRLASESWPDRGAVFHMWYITLMTFVLITSSGFMAAAVAAAKQERPRDLRRFLLLTTVCGLAFLGMQAGEWGMFIHEGARLTENPWGPAAFSAYFFLITGFHGTHVLIGVIVLLLTWRHARKGTSTPAGVETAGLYWHFVDLVWVFIFGCYYLL